MSTPSDHAKDLLVKPKQLKLWENRCAVLDQQIEKLSIERAALKSMIDGAKRLMPGAGTEAVAEVVKPMQPPPAKAPEPRGWKDLIREIVLPCDHPIAYTELIEKIGKTRLGARLRKNLKPLYAAISKLNTDREIIAYRSHVFAPAVYEKFQADVAAGLVPDLNPTSARRSPMGDAILTIMRDRKLGALSGQIIWVLKKTPEFAAAIEKNDSYPYNVLAKLVKDGHLTRRGKRYYYAYGAEMPPVDDGGEASDARA